MLSRRSCESLCLRPCCCKTRFCRFLCVYELEYVSVHLDVSAMKIDQGPDWELFYSGVKLEEADFLLLVKAVVASPN